MPRGRYNRGRRSYQRRRNNKFIVPYAKRGYLRTGGFYRKGGYGTAPSKETKFYDEINDLGNVPISVNGNILSVSLINGIISGVGESQRVGRKIQVKGIGLTFTMQVGPNVLASLGTEHMRVMLYLDKQCNGTAATVDDILESTDTAPIILSYRELENINRFRILHDKTYQLKVTSSVETVNGGLAEVRVIRKVWVNVNHPIEFTGPGPSITAIRSNNFGVLVISDKGAAIIKMSSRVRYTDS